MNRRDYLRLVGLSALALGPFRSIRAGQRPARKVVVVGAGILGAGIAYELAKRGVEVTVLEQAAPASGATGDSFAYLNASTKASAIRPYFDLNWLGILGWHAWEREPGQALPLQWSGSVYWRDQPEAVAALRETLNTVRVRGYRSRQLDAGEIRRLLPGVSQVDDASLGALYEEEGAVDPVGAVKALLARAADNGAKLLTPVTVLGLIQKQGRIVGVRTSQGELQADTVVVAAGLGSQALAESVNVKLPLAPSTGILLHTAPQPRLLDRIVFAPGSTIRQNVDGRILSSSGHEGSSLAGTPPEEIGQHILANAARYLPQLRNAAIDRVSIGQRVIPQDTLPIVGFAPRLGQLYFSVTHSGITLAPAIARFATEEILEGVALEPLASFRPARFDS
ncbi:MAG: FAD-dependent oxidoreductase [Pseudoxanthomonas sp.]